MRNSAQGEVTALLASWRGGDDQAFEKLVPLVYEELHRLARRYMRGERPGHTLQASALVNEAYLKLIDSRRVHWQDRAHFLAVAAQLMRRILVDLARSRGAAKRGSAGMRVTLDDKLELCAGRSPDLLALDDALDALAAVDARKVQVIELRYFGGLSVEETAGVLGVSGDTVLRDFRLARAWLLRELSKETRHAPG